MMNRRMMNNEQKNNDIEQKNYEILDARGIEAKCRALRKARPVLGMLMWKKDIELGARPEKQEEVGGRQ